MSETGTSQRYVLRPQLPIRQLAIASVCTLSGAVLLVLQLSQVLPTVLLVVAIVLLTFGLALSFAVARAVTRLRQVLRLDDRGLTLTRPFARHRLVWSDVKQLRLTDEGLTFASADADLLTVLNPGGASDHTFSEVVRAAQTHLDSSRGYPGSA